MTYKRYQQILKDVLKGAPKEKKSGGPQRSNRRKRKARVKCLQPGKAAALRGKHSRKVSFDEGIEWTAKRNGGWAKFRMTAPKPKANGAELREFKSQKRLAQIKSRKKGIIGANLHIGTNCI